MRRVRRSTAALALATAVCASAVAVQPAAAALTPAASWKMDEPLGAAVMTDSTGNGNHGKVPAVVRTGQVGFQGSAYLFSGEGPVTVPTSPELTPGNRAFAYGLRVKQTPTQSPGEHNLLQKGLIGGANGQYKLELDDGIPRCYVRDAKDASGVARKAAVSSPTSVADGRWHRLVCLLNASTLSLYVDGTLVAQASASAVGSIRPANDLTLGGKQTCNRLGCDYYTGLMDTAYVSVG